MIQVVCNSPRKGIAARKWFVRSTKISPPIKALWGSTLEWLRTGTVPHRIGVASWHPPVCFCPKGNRGGIPRGGREKGVNRS